MRHTLAVTFALCAAFGLGGRAQTGTMLTAVGKDGKPIPKPGAYFVTTLKNRAAELAIDLTTGGER